MSCRVAAAFLALVCFTPGGLLEARNCGSASVQVVVLDDNGASLEGVTGEDFRVNMKGGPIRALSTSYGIQAHSALILLDRSATMGQNEKFDLGRQIAISLAVSTPGTARFATFAGDVSPLADARVAVPALPPQTSADNTHAVLDALASGIRGMTPRFGDMLFVITDSADVGSHTSSREVQDLLIGSGARLFIVALPGANIGPELEQLAAVSGGSVFRPVRSPETPLNQALRDQAVRATTDWHRIVSTVYQIEFSESRPSDKPAALKVSVEKRKLKNGQFMAPAFMAPCTAIPQ